ncbi:hypothetical protein A2U01_0118044, partial [Trifolium medium]|nr:hypothetical protein [Trifolium medium]
EEQIANEEDIDAQVNLEVDQEEAIPTPKIKRIRNRPKWLNDCDTSTSTRKPNKK